MRWVEKGRNLLWIVGVRSLQESYIKGINCLVQIYFQMQCKLSHQKREVQLKTLKRKITTIEQICWSCMNLFKLPMFMSFRSFSFFPSEEAFVEDVLNIKDFVWTIILIGLDSTSRILSNQRLCMNNSTYCTRFWLSLVLLEDLTNSYCRCMNVVKSASGSIVMLSSTVRWFGSFC